MANISGQYLVMKYIMYMAKIHANTANDLLWISMGWSLRKSAIPPVRISEKS